MDTDKFRKRVIFYNWYSSDSRGLRCRAQFPAQVAQITKSDLESGTYAGGDAAGELS